MNKYRPYISDKPGKKFYIITNNNKKVYFGAKGYEHYTNGHLDNIRKNSYIKRHQKNENWNDPNTSGYWSYRYLWLYPTYKEALIKINEDLVKKGLK